MTSVYLAPASGINGPNPLFKSFDGTKDRIKATLNPTTGVRTFITRDLD